MARVGNRKFGRLPVTGGRELSDYSSWKTISGGLTYISELFYRARKTAGQIGKVRAEGGIYSQAFNYGRFMAGMMGMQGRVGGRFGSAVDTGLRNLMDRIRQGGAQKMDKSALAKEIGDLKNIVGQAAHNTGGAQGELLKALARELKDAKRNALAGGFEGIKGNSNRLLNIVSDFRKDNALEDARKKIASEIRKTAAGISSPALRQSLNNIKDELNRAANCAKNAAEKQQALAQATERLKIARTIAGNSADRQALEGLSGSADKTTGELKTAIVAQTKDRRQLILRSNVQRLTRMMGATLTVLRPLKRSIDIGNRIFQTVNSRANQFARMQMQIASERGGYGRMLRGAGINFGHMMGALAAGRSAGMEDRAVVSQMVGLQTQLAQARWGEGGLIDSAGRWGVSAFGAGGEVKSNHQLMIEFSRKLRSLGSDMEKLQFLTHQGFSPEQMEYVANYEKNARRMDYIKNNPQLQTVLDKANILDESGFSARADAATKIELKRRQILNQNAIDEGIGAALMRSIHPENWFFSDWTARQRGVASAKSEIAMEKLTKELSNLATEIRQNGEKVGSGSLSGAVTTLSAKELKGLSLSSGWAEKSQRDFGDKSAAAILKKVVGVRSSDVKEARKAAKGSSEAWERWQKKTGLTNLKRSQVLDVDFDKESLEGAKVQSLVARATELAGGKEVNLEALGGDKYLDIMTSGLKVGSEEFEKRVVEAMARTTGDTVGKSEAILRVIQKGVDVKDPALAKKIDELSKSYIDKGMGASDARAKAAEEVKTNILSEANKSGDLINRQIEENRKANDAKYQRVVEESAQEGKKDEEYKELVERLRAQQSRTKGAANMSFEEYRESLKKHGRGNKAWTVQGAFRLDELERDGSRRFDAEKGAVTAERKPMSKEEWDAKNLGSQAKQERRAYQQLYGKGGVLEGQEAPWSSLTGTIKNDKINAFLSRKNIGGEKVKGYDNLLNAMDDDTLVEKIALEQGTSADEIRNNILTKEQYDQIKARQNAGEKIVGKDAAKMRIYESSPVFRKAKEDAAKKKEDQKREETEGINDIATYAAAARMTGDTAIHTDGSGYAALGSKAREKYGKQAEQSGIEPKVDRKKLIRLVAAGGGDLEKNFSPEEVAAFRKEQDEEKQTFMSKKGNSEGKYKLFKDVEARMLRGEEVSDKERAMYNAEKKAMAYRKVQRKGPPLHKEYVPTAEEKAASDAVDAKFAKLKKKQIAAKKRPPLAQLSDMKRMESLAKAGMTKTELARRFTPKRVRQLESQIKAGKIEDPFSSPAARKRAEAQSARDARNKKKGVVFSGYSTEQAAAGAAATQTMNQKAAAAQQASAIMNQKGAAAETAAASAKQGAAGKDAGPKNVTINFGGQTNNLNVQGQGMSLDEKGVMEGLRKGGDMLENKTAQEIANHCDMVGVR